MLPEKAPKRIVCQNGPAEQEDKPWEAAAMVYGTNYPQCPHCGQPWTGKNQRPGIKTCESCKCEFRLSLSVCVLFNCAAEVVHIGRRAS